MTLKRVLETGETPAKLQKLDETLLKDLLARQTEIHTLENQCSDEQQTLLQAFDVKKQPILAKRGDIFKGIPKFWRTVFEHIPLIPEVELLDVKEEELLILDYLVDINVEEIRDVEKRKHTFTFTFSENPYFNETVLKKDVMDAPEEGTLAMTIPEITWKENPLDKQGEEEEDSHMTFFVWLMSEISVDGDFGHVFRELVWSNPVSVYELEDDEDDGEGEGEGEGEGDDGEGNA